MDMVKLLQKLSSEGLRAYHVSYARFFDSVSDALLWEYLCQHIDAEGRFKTSENDIITDLGLKRDALRGCRERLTNRGVLSFTTVRGGVGKTETTYHVDQAKFTEQFVAWLEEGDEGAAPVTEPTPEPPPPAPPSVPVLEAGTPAVQAEQLSAEADALALASEWADMGFDATRPPMYGLQNSAPIPASPAPATGSAPKAKRGANRNAELFPLALALIEVTASDRNVHMGQAMKVAAVIAKSEKAKPNSLLITEKYGAGGWWYTTDWRGKKGQMPTFWTIQQTWANWVGTEQGTSHDFNGAMTDAILQYGVPGFSMPTV